jgi:U3 small nucleolar RNA-associated protein MPP10
MDNYSNVKTHSVLQFVNLKAGLGHAGKTKEDEEEEEEEDNSKELNIDDEEEGGEDEENEEEENEEDEEVGEDEKGEEEGEAKGVEDKFLKIKELEKFLEDGEAEVYGLSTQKNKLDFDEQDNHNESDQDEGADDEEDAFDVSTPHPSTPTNLFSLT